MAGQVFITGLTDFRMAFNNFRGICDGLPNKRRQR